MGNEDVNGTNLIEKTDLLLRRSQFYSAFKLKRDLFRTARAVAMMTTLIEPKRGKEN